MATILGSPELLEVRVGGGALDDAHPMQLRTHSCWQAFDDPAVMAAVSEVAANPAAYVSACLPCIACVPVTDMHALPSSQVCQARSQPQSEGLLRPHERSGSQAAGPGGRDTLWEGATHSSSGDEGTATQQATSTHHGA